MTTRPRTTTLKLVALTTVAVVAMLCLFSLNQQNVRDSGPRRPVAEQSGF